MHTYIHVEFSPQGPEDLTPPLHLLPHCPTPTPPLLARAGRNTYVCIHRDVKPQMHVLSLPPLTSLCVYMYISAYMFVFVSVYGEKERCRGRERRETETRSPRTIASKWQSNGEDAEVHGGKRGAACTSSVERCTYSMCTCVGPSVM